MIVEVIRRVRIIVNQHYEEEGIHRITWSGWIIRLSEFQGIGSEDPEQHLFVCETIWAAENVHDEVVKIMRKYRTNRIPYDS